MDESARALKALMAEFASRDDGDELNEAATRLLLVDRILSDVLGWSKSSFNPEDAVAVEPRADKKQTVWLDYHLLDASTPQRLVVEAKRTGVTFSLNRTKKRRKVPVASLLQNQGDHLREAIQQARSYCINAGTDAFVITNGYQWIGSIAFANSVALEKLQAVVFDSLEQIYEDLPRFLDLFSPAGISARLLAQEATGDAIQVPTFAQRLNGGVTQTQSAEKNYLIGPLQMLMKLCFSDLTSEEHAEMLEQCYVATDAASTGMRTLEAFVGSNLPQGLENSKRLDRGDDGGQPFPEPANLRGGTVLLAGRAGSGKSTFLAHTKRRLIKKFGEFKHLILHCDLLDKTEIHSKSFDHERFVADVSTELLRVADAEFPQLSPYRHEHLREIFHGELRVHEKGLDPKLRGTEYDAVEQQTLIQKHLAKPLAHLKAYLGYLDRSGYATTVLLDNVDRGTEEFERVTFQFAEMLGRNARTTVVVSLRDTTIDAGKRQNFLDVRQCPVVTLTPPPFLEVAQRRFEYAQTAFKSDPYLWRKFQSSLGGQPFDRVLDFAAILAEMVLRQPSNVADMIAALSGTNMRQALGFLEEFSVSPWTDLNALFRAYQERAMGRASSQTFLRSVMKRDKRRYVEDDSARVMNLFRADGGRIVSHFTGVRVLQYLDWYGRTVQRDVPIRLVLAVFTGIGYATGEVRFALDRLGEFGLVGSLSRGEPPWEEGDSVRLGVAGEYYLHKLLIDREYLFNVVDDAVVYEAAVFEELRSAEKQPDQPLVRRLEDRLRLFLHYLRRKELDELSRLKGVRQRATWIEEVCGPALVATLGRAALAERPSDPPPKP